MNTVKNGSSLSPEVLRKVARVQINEVTEYHIYKHLARNVKSPSNRAVLNKIADEELEHYRFWMDYNDEVEPWWWKVKLYIMVSRLFGLVFSLKLMERAEASAQKNYLELSKVIPEVEKIIEQETNHEKTLLNMLSDLRIRSFGTWLISMNMVLFVMAGILTALPNLMTTGLAIGITGVLTAVVVSLADFANTFLLKIFGKLNRELFMKSLRRMFTGIVTGILVSLPFFILGTGYMPLIISLTIILFLSCSINFYYAVISDHPIFDRILRVILTFIIIGGLVSASFWGLGLIIGA